jgi:hypothetical protein
MTPPFINRYSFGSIQIDGEEYNKDVIILPDRIIKNWHRITGHELDLTDLKAVIETPPEILVIGTGSVGRMKVPDRTKAALKYAGIKFYSLPTKEACNKYNQLREKSQTCAALHLTC